MLSQKGKNKERAVAFKQQLKSKTNVMAISLPRKRMRLKVVKMTHEELKRELREIKQAIRSLEQALSAVVVKQQPLLNALETTKRLNCSYRKLQDLLAKGEIECVTVGGRRMFTEKNITDYLQGK